MVAVPARMGSTGSALDQGPRGPGGGRGLSIPGPELESRPCGTPRRPRRSPVFVFPLPVKATNARAAWAAWAQALVPSRQCLGVPRHPIRVINFLRHAACSDAVRVSPGVPVPIQDRRGRAARPVTRAPGSHSSAQ